MSSENFNQRPASRGATLIELAIGILLMVIIGIAVSSLVRAGIETQMSQRLVNVSQVIVMNVMDDLRFDLRTASSAVISGGGSTLTVTNTSGDNIVYTYNAGALTMTRTINGNAKTYNANVSPAISVNCTAPCFRGQRVNKNFGPPVTFTVVADTATPQTVIVGDMWASPANNVDGASVIAKHFANPRLFTIRQASYDVAANSAYN